MIEGTKKGKDSKTKREKWINSETKVECDTEIVFAMGMKRQMENNYLRSADCQFRKQLVLCVSSIKKGRVAFLCL